MLLPLLLGLGGIAFVLSQKKAAPQLPGYPTLPLTEVKSPGQPTATSTVKRTLPAKPVEQSAQGVLSDDMRMTIAKILRDLGVQDDGTIDCKTANARAVQTATTLAAQLDLMKQQIAAQQLREYAKKAAACVPTPPAAKQAPLPAGLTAAEKEQIQRSLVLEGDPGRLREVAGTLERKYPNDPSAKALVQTMREKATQIENLMATASALTKVNQVMTESVPKTPQPSPTTATPTDPIPVPVVPSPGTLPEQATPLEMLAKAASTELKRAQRSAKTIRESVGKENQAIIKKFQAAAGLTADGLAGPKTILALAQFEDLVPFVQRWPKGANANTVKQFRAELLKLNTPGRQLHIAAAAEKGQSMGLNVA